MTGWDAALAGVVELPDGRSVRGRGLRGGAPRLDEPCDFGIYLTSRPPSLQEWESRWVRWPDFALPASDSEALDALVEAFDRAASSRVEIACSGGTGRTGTALAVLARLAGVPADDAVTWVRTHYRPRAVETPAQRAWTRAVVLPR